MIFTAAAALPIYSLVQLYGACRANEMKFMQIAARPAGPSTLLYRGGDASNLYHEGETVLPPFATVNVASNEVPTVAAAASFRGLARLGSSSLHMFDVTLEPYTNNNRLIKLSDGRELHLSEFVGGKQLIVLEIMQRGFTDLLHLYFSFAR